MKPLLVILQPRDIPQFTSQMYDGTAADPIGVRYDRLILKYWPRHTAYLTARAKFLELSKTEGYTHMVRITDDIQFTNRNLDRLLDVALSLSIPIVAADCNADLENPHLHGFIHRLPENTVLTDLLERDKYGTYPFTSDDYLRDKKFSLIKVIWSGLHLAVLSKQAVSQLSFMNDFQYTKRTDVSHFDGCCTDLVTAIEAQKHGIRMYVDLNCRIRHLKPSVKRNEWLEEYNRVGVKPKECYLQRAL